MVHKRYIKRGGKVYGPYFYKSIRTKDGKVKNIYLGDNYDEKDNPQKISKHNNVVQTKISGFNPAYEGLSLRIMLVLLLICTCLGLGYLGVNSITGHITYEPINGVVTLENMGEQVVQVGQSYDVALNVDEFGDKNVLFNDDSKLFDIGGDGRINFVPREEDVGEYHIAIIAKNSEKQDEIYMKIVKFVVVNDE